MRPGGGGNEAYMASSDLLMNSALADFCATLLFSPTIVLTTVLDTPNPFMTYVLTVWIRTKVVPRAIFVENRIGSPSFYA